MDSGLRTAAMDEGLEGATQKERDYAWLLRWAAATGGGGDRNLAVSGARAAVAMGAVRAELAVHVCACGACRLPRTPFRHRPSRTPVAMGAVRAEPAVAVHVCAWGCVRVHARACLCARGDFQVVHHDGSTAGPTC